MLLIAIVLVIEMDSNYPHNKYRGKDLPPSNTWYSQMPPLDSDSGSSRGSKSDLGCSPSQHRVNVGICPEGCDWDGTYDKCVPKKSILKKNNERKVKQDFDLVAGLDILDEIEFPPACRAFNGSLFGK